MRAPGPALSKSEQCAPGAQRRCDEPSPGLRSGNGRCGEVLVLQGLLVTGPPGLRQTVAGMGRWKTPPRASVNGGSAGPLAGSRTHDESPATPGHARLCDSPLCLGFGHFMSHAMGSAPGRLVAWFRRRHGWWCRGLPCSKLSRLGTHSEAAPSVRVPGSRSCTRTPEKRSVPGQGADTWEGFTVHPGLWVGSQRFRSRGFPR